MVSKNEKIKVINYLYEEMTPKERKAFYAELKNFPDLKENINSIKNIRNSINNWKVSNIPKNIVDSFAIYSAAKKMERSSRLKMQLWSKAVIAASFLIVLFAVLNLNISFSNNGFSIGFGLLSGHTPAAMSEKFSGEINKNNEQLLQVVRSYILERDQRQIDEIVRFIKTSEIQANEKRKYELKAIYTELANLKLNTNRYLVNANQAIQGLFQYMTDIDAQKTNSPGRDI